MSEINKFMEFVDRTLLLHDVSNIQKFHLKTNKHIYTNSVHSWIANLTRRNIEELHLLLDQDTPFFISLSLFTCQSLIKLDLTANSATHLPRSFCFPKLKRLTLRRIQFTDDCWNEQHFSKCPVIEELILSDSTWFGVRNFCISTPTLKLLNIYTWEADGLQDCALKINAPNLVSLAYLGCVAKEYVLSSFQALESAEVYFCTDDVQIEQEIGNVAAASKFTRALSHVQNLELHAETLEALSIANDFVNILPVFHDLKYLILVEGKTTDKSLFTLFKAVPNLRCLVFEEASALNFSFLSPVFVEMAKLVLGFNLFLFFCYLILTQGCIDDNKEEEHSWVIGVTKDNLK
ncbi:putative F-box/FBD/LRR-repeat protein At3g59240 [Papaver somniferum]|uniref:putative F-box/FBD/LRR-repeat protein At3g59240 n=1 Tax=Papaver somniferum TaxID=3469 RepID=UPI000E6F9103|nr:putative F-box/FBD/LRR-repeat protein At3g59240 [Papaver somniferum]